MYDYFEVFFEAFLADFFMNFIVAVFFFEIVYFPIAKPCIKYEETVKEIQKSCFSLNGTKLNVNDGIAFFDEKNELCGTKIEKIINI